MGDRRGSLNWDDGVEALSFHAVPGQVGRGLDSARLGNLSRGSGLGVARVGSHACQHAGELFRHIAEHRADDHR